MTKDALVAALEDANGNISAAARALGVSRQTIHSWIKRFDLELSVQVSVGAPEITPTVRRYRRSQTAAIQAVGAAVADGRLSRQPCEVCGSTKVEAHHHLGYEPEHRLDVRWLCHSHHRLEHKKAAK